ncbi:MAG: ribosomal protein S18-alanine N-acetyltransferase [Clostridia bacterium]|nr:ribosomal protein S18-alanine N-acetyltransferase [Clostridia bacterium]MDD4386891.1 ribosomal protein S18-alanine N-acetyltransferase [Clostridia bacterium]
MKNINPVISKMKINEIDEIMNMQLINNNIILSKSSILNDFESSNAIYFVAKLNNIIIGYIAANLLYDHIDILSVLVSNEYVKNGIASTLLSAVLNYAININISEILLEVRLTNIPAQRLYEKFGFNKINIRKKYYQDNLEDAIIYKLSLQNNINL